MPFFFFVLVRRSDGALHLVALVVCVESVAPSQCATGGGVSASEKVCLTFSTVRMQCFFYESHNFPAPS